MWLDDLITVMVDANVALTATFFKSSKAGIPTGEGPYFLLTATGGVPPAGVHGNPNAYRFPGAQVQVRASKVSLASPAASAAWLALSVVRNRVINGTFYRSITMLQSEPYDLGLDDTQRLILAFNVLGDRR